jgi:peroxiredoxin
MDPPLSISPILIASGMLLAVVAAQTWFMLHVLRQHGRMLLRVDALETAPRPELVAPRLAVGAAAPDFTLPDLLSGAQVSLRGLRSAGQAVLLVFVDPDCGSCVSLLPELAVWQRDHGRHLQVSILSLGNPTRNQAAVASLGLSHVLLQREQEVADLYQVLGTPSGVLVTTDGRIGAPLAEGVEAIRRLQANALPTSFASYTRVLEHTPVY